ncbi:MAG: M1 family metallopeptidase [bacterium]|nr:M1 family metallopeptidase [bacterium]
MFPIALLLVASTADARLGKEVVPVKQLIDLTINADSSHYSGFVVIDLSVNKATDRFALQAEEMELGLVELTNITGLIETEIEMGKHGLLSILAGERLSPGNYRLRIEFENDFNTNAVGLYRVIENENGYLFTQFEEDDAREAFPCFDEPEFKIPFQMTLRVPTAHYVIANTPIESETETESWKAIKFAETRPLPTYLLAIATGKLETVDIPGMSIPGRVVTVQGKSDLTSLAIKMTPPILAALENYFGSPYPYKKLDLIAVPEFWAGAMENAGAITFRETALAVDEASASVSTRRRMASIIAHELAHMWFGDLVTMVWWDDLWLNEAFASWMGDKIVDQVYPEFNMPITVVHSSQRVMSSDTRKSTSPIRQETADEENLLQNIGIIYSKGQAVLQMFENWLGEKSFQNGVKQYLKDHEWGNAVADDLWNALTNASGRDVNGSLSTFVLQPGVPLVTVEPGPGGEVTITQKRFSNYGTDFPEAKLWKIPITLKYSVDNEIKTYSLLLTEESSTFRLPGESRPDWVLPNAEMNGYYRWLVPADQMKLMAESAATLLTSAERVGFLSNMSGLLNADLITGGDYLSVISRFSKDEHPDVARGVIGALSRIHTVFVNDSNQDAFAELVRASLRPTMDRIGLEPTESEDEAIALLRPSLIGFIADEGKETEVLDYAKEKAAAYLDDKSAVDPALIGTMLTLSAFDGDQKMYNEYKSRAEQAETPVERSRFLYTLGNFRDRAIVDQALEYALSDHLRPQELGTIPRSVASHSPEMNSFIFDWITKNYDRIVAKIPPPSRSYLAFYASGCDEDLLKKGLDFFTQPEHSSPGMESRLARVKESTEDCLSLREREEESVAEFLKAYGGTK